MTETCLSPCIESDIPIRAAETLVVVPIRFPDGRLYHDLHSRGGEYLTLPDERQNEELAAQFIAAGAEVLDPDAWVMRGQSLTNHSPLWTTHRNYYVIASYPADDAPPRFEIYSIEGTPYEVEDVLREQVLARMMEAKDQVVQVEELDGSLANRREQVRIAEERENRLWRRCFPKTIPRRWRRHRIEQIVSPEEGLPPKRGEAGFDAWASSYFCGQTPFTELRSLIPDFLEQLQPDDELWFFSSPATCWDRFAGRAGYCTVRNGRSVAHVETVVS